jgi:hypothetical protein
MLLLDALDVLDDLVPEQREIMINGLIQLLSKVSYYAILESQFEWDGSRPFEDFVIYQNDIIRMCVEIETSTVGKVIRRMENKPPLSLRANICI